MLLHKNSKVILLLILATFFLKGVFLSSSYPIFGGQDESRHYNTIQYFAEPKEKSWELQESLAKRDENQIETYRYSDEIRKTIIATDTNIIRGELFNTINFSNDYVENNEAAINSLQWKPYNYNLQPEIIAGSLFHAIASLIEKVFNNQNILVRFYLTRIFCVFLGTLAILFFYLTTKTIGISSKNSLLLTAIISFQPKFSAYLSNVNYDALLIPLFFLFTLAGVMLLKNGLNWKNLLLLLASTILAITTKITGLVLLVIFASIVTFLLYTKVKTKSKNIRYLIYFTCVLLFILLAMYLGTFLPTKEQSISQIFNSVQGYLKESKGFGLSARTYWGTPDDSLQIIKYIEILALIGIGLLFFSKKESAIWQTNFLPEKKYVFFLLFMVVTLQLEIRVADWTFFNRLGRIETGMPGRYFLPNLGAHIMLMFIGLGAIFAYFKREQYLEKALIVGMLAMFSFSFYTLFNGLILRYYL